MRLDALPVYKGLPVPNIVLWDSESLSNDDRRCGIAPHPLLGTPQMILDPEHDDDRDANGVLWAPERDLHKGKPQFSQLNGKRQRRSLLEGRCQVCDHKMPDDAVTFVLPMEFRSRESMQTGTAPVCEECAPVALDLCPHLKSLEMLRATAPTPILSGYFGDWVNPRTGEMHHKQMLPVGDHRLATFLAKQAIALISPITWSAL